jgi:hypothetical protein
VWGEGWWKQWSACLASMKPRVQTPVLSKKKKSMDGVFPDLCSVGVTEAPKLLSLLGIVARTCNPSYLGYRDREDLSGSRPVRANS